MAQCNEHNEIKEKMSFNLMDFSSCCVNEDTIGHKLERPGSCFFKQIFYYLAVPSFTCGMWGLVAWPGIPPWAPALGLCSLNCWTIKEVPELLYLFIYLFLLKPHYPSKSEVLLAQLCPTLCDPMDYTPPGPCPWNSPGMNTGVGCLFLLQGHLPDSGIEPGSPAL